MGQLISLDSVPVVDNHCHANQREQRTGSGPLPIRAWREGHTRGYVEARVPGPVWHEYIAAQGRGDAPTVERIRTEYRIPELMAQAMAMQDATGQTHALRVGCREMYGEWENEQRLAELSAEARRDGIGAIYERAMDLVNCPAVIVDSPRIDRSLLSEKRFKWIGRLDPFFYPFGAGPGSRNSAHVASFFARLKYKFDLALQEQGLSAAPTDFADYLAFADRVMQSHVERGAVGMKVISVYVRPLEFRAVSESDAGRVFQEMAAGRKEEHRLFEDFMARRLLLWCADRGLPVQVHVGTGTAERGIDHHWCNPLLLESVLMDEEFNGLRLVLLHGGYPFCSEAAALAWTYGNVYLDFSLMTYFHPNYLADRLTEWMEFLHAHKLLFGTDTGLPEVALGAIRLGRRAVETALSRCIEDDFWTMGQAVRLGERVLGRNTCELYGFTT